MKLSYEKINNIAKEYGESFYILDTEQFKKNFNELLTAFREIYSESYIAYSYKTNYTPRLCKIVDELGGYAEVVSDMEVEIARRVGVKPERIIFNGPYKNQAAVRDLLLDGGCVNIDSYDEFKYVKKIVEENTDKKIHIGIRCNFEINDGVLSRFGIDVESKEFDEIVKWVNTSANVCMEEMHCHFAARSLKTWAPRAEKMIALTKEKFDNMPKHIDLGGGIFGKMADSLKAQFDDNIPEYKEYADVVATKFAQAFGEMNNRPKLFIEPGSALVGDCMKFVCEVVSIKKVRNKPIATLLGSIYNINPTLNKKNPPISVYNKNEESEYFEDLDFGGFTCIESDYLYRHYDGKLAVGDYVMFGNVGSYSVVLKPPFILPNFPVIEIMEDDKISVVKEKETFDDLFHTYSFE